MGIYIDFDLPQRKDNNNMLYIISIKKIKNLRNNIKFD